jgi:penicillin-binding protein 2
MEYSLADLDKDHTWFVSFAPRARPEIASVVLVENSGFGGVHAAPKAAAIYQAYYQRTGGVRPEYDV